MGVDGRHPDRFRGARRRRPQRVARSPTDTDPNDLDFVFTAVSGHPALSEGSSSPSMFGPSGPSGYLPARNTLRSISQCLARNCRTPPTTGSSRSQTSSFPSFAGSTESPARASRAVARCRRTSSRFDGSISRASSARPGHSMITVSVGPAFAVRSRGHGMGIDAFSSEADGQP